MESISLNDRKVIAAQIGRRPRGLAGVSARCSYGFPQVIRVRAIVDGKPFPTLYWLSCPYLTRSIDRVEADGWIPRLERRMAEDEALRAAMDEAHARYITQRLATLATEERIAIERRGLIAGLRQRGIGGIDDRRRLKCLHLHAGHALAADNPIGAIVLSMLPAPQCAADEVICSALG